MADVLVRIEGHIVMFTPESDFAKEWVSENLSLESWQWWGNAFAVEMGYAGDLIQGMMGDGLEVIPESHNMTDEDKQYLAKMGITASKTAAVPFMPVRPQTTSTVPPAPGAPVPPGESMAVNEKPEEEKHTVVPELPNALFHMAGWGGWSRVSMNTVQSDDKRFTITQIDPTRRIKTFMLKDLETGESYEERTMRGAKKKAKEIREGASEPVIAPVVEEPAQPTYTPPVVMTASYTNPLLLKKK